MDLHKIRPTHFSVPLLTCRTARHSQRNILTETELVTAAHMTAGGTQRGMTCEAVPLQFCETFPWLIVRKMFNGSQLLRSLKIMKACDGTENKQV
jgi:hypothetical protein